MKKISKIGLLLLLILGVFIATPVQADGPLEVLQRDGSDVRHYNSTDKVMIPTNYIERATEFRGVWVATVYNLNIDTHTSETQYKAEFQTLVDEMLESNANAMLFQVRPTNDAFYDSNYAPWSRYLTGTEGNDPGWNVLEWMIETCHDNGIEFHAWMNPYRVATSSLSKTDYLNTLDDDNFAKQNPDLVISGNLSSGKYPHILNPGEPEVKAYIQNVVEEIITDYDIDGVHFDDYFYPYSGTSTDTTTYNTYKEAGQTISDWRRENVNDVVEGVKEIVDTYNEDNGTDIRFGISPFGLWGSEYNSLTPGGSNTASGNGSSYTDQYADSKRWVEEGWVHYICPQVYWTFTHSTAPYADVVDWWVSTVRGTGVDLVIGHSPYHASAYDWDTEDISDQLRYNQQHPEIKGSVMYSMDYIDHAHLQLVEQDNWTITPINTWEQADVDIEVTIDGEMFGNIYADDVTVTLSSIDTILYKIDEGPWVTYTMPFEVSGDGAHALYMKTVDSSSNESPVTSENIVIQYLNTDVPVIAINGDTIDGNYVIGSEIVLSSDSEDIYVAINHGNVGEFELYSGPIELDDTGNYYIRVKTIDERGTESEEVTMSLYVQAACYLDPVIHVDGVGTNDTYQSVSISLTRYTSVEYQINGGDWQFYMGSFDIDTEGDYTVTVRNQDECATEVSTSFSIDTTAPDSPVIDIAGDYDGERYYTSTVSFAFDVSDDSHIQYRVHNGSRWTDWETFSAPIELLYDGNFTVEYKSVDEALNEATVVSTRIRIQLPNDEKNIYVVRDGEIVTYRDTNIPIELPIEYTEKNEEIRAVWIATVANIDMPIHDSEEQYKEYIIEMLDNIEALNFNTIFFQVRPQNDAFYDSSYAPWSRHLTGLEGRNPGWDVLEFLITESHKRGIEFHAWLNPYRVTTSAGDKDDLLATLHDDNWAKQNPDMVMVDGADKLILNPGERQVQVYIRNVINELISLYDVDGIHFDDYFYSYNGTPLEEDSNLYDRKKEAGQSLDDWRRENINTVVREIFELVEEYNENFDKTIMFGISPFGVWKSGGEDGSNTSPYTLQSYSDQYADSKRWVEEGWVHYILPQLYWDFDHRSAPFADLVDWWAELCEANDVYLIVGQGLYQYSTGDWNDENEFIEQIRYMSQYDSVIGTSIFSYKHLDSYNVYINNSLTRLTNTFFTEYATFPWESNVEKYVPVCEVGYHIEGYDCVKDPLVCEPGYHIEGESCVKDELICSDGYHVENDSCVEDEPICPEGYERVDGGCQKVETGCGSMIFSSSFIVVITALIGGLFFFKRKLS